MEMGYAFSKIFSPSYILFVFYSGSEVLVLTLQIKALWVISGYFCCSSSPHFIVGSVSQTGTKYRHSPKVLSQTFPSISIMSAFPIVHHMPNQVRLKAFFSSYCVCKSAGFQSEWLPKLLVGLMQCGGAETCYSDRADMNQYKVIKQQQLNTLF